MGFQSRKIFDILAEECTLRGVFSATERRRGIMRYRPIRRNSEFGRVYARGKSYVNPGLVMYVLKTRSKKTRVGLTATKKIGKAVCRNRCKRIIRAAFHQVEPQIGQGWDFVFVARSRTPFVKSQKVYDAMKNHMESAGVLKK